MLSKTGEIWGKNKCLDFSGDKRLLGIKDQIHLLECHKEQGNQNWWMDNDGLIHHNSGYCLELNNQADIVMEECKKYNQRQMWLWKKVEKII